MRMGCAGCTVAAYPDVVIVVDRRDRGQGASWSLRPKGEVLT